MKRGILGKPTRYQYPSFWTLRQFQYKETIKAKRNPEPNFYGETMSTATQHKIIDGDGHVMEDIASIWKYMPEQYVGKSFSDMRGRSPFPPIDHLHTANRHFTPKGAFANVAAKAGKCFSKKSASAPRCFTRAPVWPSARSSAAIGP